VSIEARLQFPHLDIKAFEIREQGRELMHTNARKFSAPGIETVIGDFLSVDIPDAELCDAAFIGGHGGHLKEIMQRVHSHLSPNGCIVFNSVTPDSRAAFEEAAATLGMELHPPCHLQLATNNPITILKAVKDLRKGPFAE
jgi:precorrin-6Y C5,15-methyltransferase (decarboxylating)